MERVKRERDTKEMCTYGWSEQARKSQLIVVDVSSARSGGRNGFGAKLCNIHSTRFTLRTASSRQRLLFEQVELFFYYQRIRCQLSVMFGCYR